MTMMNWRIVLIAAILTLGLTGCKAKSDGAFEKQKDQPYANVVSLSPSTTEVLMSIGGDIYISGRTSACDRPNHVVNVPVMTKGTKPDYEKILESDIDLIIFDKMLYSDDEVAKIESLGITTLERDATNVEEYADFCYRLASKISMEGFMSTYVDKVFEQQTAAESWEGDNPKTTILLGGMEEQYLIMGDAGLHADMIDVCGGTPVAVPGKLFQPVKFESLIEMDPEIIFSDGHAVEILSDPRLSGLTAVKEGFVYDVDERSLVRLGSRFDKLIQSIHIAIRTRPVAKIEEAVS